MAINNNDPIIPGGSFTWGEFLILHNWSTPTHPVYAVPNAQQIENAKVLFTHLEPLRKLINKPMEIVSGLRTPDYVRYLRAHKIPAALNGPHNQGCAVDVVCPGMKVIDLWKFMNDHWEGREENFSSTPTWVHIDIWEWGKRIRFNP